jgi:hypothetical protein
MPTRGEAEAFANGFTFAASELAGIQTVGSRNPDESVGWLEFVMAYGNAQEEFNNNAGRAKMPSVIDAWHYWQESRGRYIDRECCAACKIKQG